MFKRFVGVVASLFAMVLLAAPASAISLSSLEQISEPSDSIETNTPAEGYDFDINLLDRNLEIDYSATVTNDSEKSIKITSIDFENSNYNFLDYDYDGIAVYDTLAPGEARQLNISVKSNSNPTQTVSEDYLLKVNYQEIEEPTPSPTPEDNPDDNPNTATTKVVTVVSIFAFSTLVGALLFNKNIRRKEFMILFALPVAGFILFANSAKATEDENFQIKGRVNFINVYTVTVDPDGGVYNDTTEPTISKVRDSETFHVGEATRDTYSFVEWEVNPGELDINNDIVITSDTTIRAIWNENHFTLTVNPNGGSYKGSTKVATFQYREGATASIDEPIYAGHNFTGWTISPTLAFTNEIVMDKDYTITANWEDIYYNVTIDPNSGSYDNHTEAYTTSYKYGTEITMSEATREHYTFSGWAMSAGHLNSESKFTVTQDTTLTAQWNAVNHTLTIDPNSGVYGEHTEEFSETYFDGTTVNLETPSKEHYHFVGWTLEDETTYTQNFVVMNRDIKLIANYEIDQFTVTIDPNGGSYDNHTESYTTTYDYGTEVTISNATREHYTFSGWEMSTGSLDENSKFTVTENTTLTAQWEAINHTLTIDPNGGSYGEHTEEFSESYFEGTTVNLETPSREHYSFSGWTLENGDEYTENSVVMNQDVKLIANYEIDKVTVTINPNGGSYQDSTEIWSGQVDYGSTVDLSGTTWIDHEITHWTQNNEEIPADTTEVTIYEDTDFVAYWQSSIIYTVTINPNGGSYDDSTEPSQYQVREGTDYELLEATRTGYGLTKWTDDSGNELSAETEAITVTGDITLTADWFRAVAKIKRTGKVYPSIMAAHAAANPEGFTDDTIILLVDTHEIVTNSKKVTLDLDSHVVYGYLVNTAAGDIRLINGEINNYAESAQADETATFEVPVLDTVNPDGAAVINNGVLTMGIDDYEDDDAHQKAAHIVRDNIRLIGKNVGLQQNATFDFFDGYIEGTIGLVGGYRNSPWYRDSSDQAASYEIHYWPVVSQNAVKNCQHVELNSSDRAVSKTTTNGEVYYYNLQDNINVSAVTGYDIYIVRNLVYTPTVDSSLAYEITVPENVTTNIDTAGWDVDFNNTMTINGTLNLTNGNKNTHVSDINFAQTMQNNGTLNISDVNLKATTNNTLLNLNGSLSLTNANLSSDNSTVINVTGENASIAADDNSHISTTSTSTSIPALNNQSYSLTLNGGNFDGACMAIKNEKDKTLTITSATVHSTASSSDRCAGVYNDGTLDISDINLTVDGGSVYYARGIINNKNLTVSGGNINITHSGNGNSSSTATGIWASSAGNTLITGGNIIATNNAYTAYAIYGSNLTIDEESANSLTLKAIGAQATGINASNAATINGGSIIAESTTNNAIAFEGRSGSVAVFNINGGNLSAKSTTSNAYGVFVNTSDYKTTNITGGNISATTQADNKIAAGVYVKENDEYLNITGGDIYGDTYGVLFDTANIDHPVNIGNVEEPLYNGVNKDADDNILPAKPIITGGVYGVNAAYVNFYDGIVRGAENHFYSMDQIKAIPAGTTYAYGTSGDYEHAIWLKYAENYLHVEGGDDYNSLAAAYANTPDGGTISVIKNYSTEETLPTIEKNITLNLNDKSLTYSQPIVNNDILTITGGANGTGTLTNSNSSVNVIKNSSAKDANNATLNIESGTIIGACTAIRTERTNTSNNYPAASLNITGGTLKTNAAESECHVIYTNRSEVNISNALITGETNTVNYKIDGVYAYSGNNTITMNSGTIDITAPIAYGFASYGSARNTVYINDGTIKATSVEDSSNTNRRAYAVSVYSNLTIGKTDGSTSPIITAKYGYDARGVSNSGSNTINNGTITVTNTTNESIGVYGGGTINNGTITSQSTKTAKGLEYNTYTIKDGTITATSTSGDAFGVGRKNDTSYTIVSEMSGGSITAKLAEGNTTGVAHGIDVVHSLITGGSVHGDTYGINHKNSTSSYYTTLGVNDTDYHNGVSDNNPQPYISGDIYAINGGYINFYDGKLHGGTNYISSPDNIKAIPTSATYAYANETEEGHEDCWLIEATKYLRIMRKNTTTEEYEEVSRHNSLSDAFDKAQNGDIIEVIESYSTEATHEANKKNVTLDLHGKSLIYKNPIINDANATLTITDLSDSKNGSITSTNPTANKPAIKNNSDGTLIVDGGLISSAYNTVINDGAMTVNGGTISIADGTKDTASAIQNNGTLNIFGGTIQAIDENSTDVFFAAVGNKGTTNMYGGTVTAYGKGYAHAIRWVRGSTANIYSGTITATSINSRAVGLGAYRANIAKSEDYPDLPEVTITATGKNPQAVSGTTTDVSAGEITAISTGDYSGSDNAIGIDTNTLTLSGGTITVSGSGRNKGVTSYGQEITGGTIDVSSTTQNAYGVYISGSYTGTASLSGATVTATTTAEGKIGEAIYAPNNHNVTITSGTYIGSTYGLYSEALDNGKTISLGTNDATYNNGYDDDLLLTIRGGVYGAYGGDIYFYDGQLQGAEAAYFDRNIKGVADNSTINQTTKTIDGTEYDVKYVTSEHYVAKIGTGSCYPTVTAGTSCYNSLQKAITAAQTGDTITLIEDNYVYEPLTIDSTKDFTIELDNHTIVTGNPVTNSGKLKIQNTPNSKPVISYHETDCFITNNQGSSFTLQNAELNASCAFDSKDSTTTTIEDAVVSQYDNGNITLIKSSGDLTIDNSDVSAKYHVIDHKTGALKIINGSTVANIETESSYSYPVVKTTNSTVTITSSNLIHNNIAHSYNDYPYSYLQTGANSQAAITSSTLSGVFKLEAGTASVTGSTINHLGISRTEMSILENATVNFDNTTINLEPYYSANPLSATLNNYGTLSLTNGSKVIINNENKRRFIAVLNKGTFNLDKSEISYAYNENATGYSGSPNYGFYMVKGSVNVLNNSKVSFDFSNSSTGNSTVAYGFYVQEGSINVQNSKLEFSSSNVNTLYGMYLESSDETKPVNVNLDKGHIYATGAVNSYGVYIAGSKSSFTMGVKETDTSLYGTDFAIKDDPVVKATGSTTGIGIKHPTGSFNFYDGEIIGSSAAKPEGTTDAEYEYEAKETLGADGNYHCILDWIHN